MRQKNHKSKACSSGRQPGFTLLELMVTVAVIAIIASIAMPSFREMLLRSRLTSAANEITAAMQQARMEALRTNARVELCPSTNGTACAGSNWARFIMVSSRQGLLKDIRLNPSSITALGSSNVTSANKIWYLADGFVRTGPTAAPVQQGTIGICTTGLSADNARDIQVSMGRVSVARATRAACAAPGN